MKKTERSIPPDHAEREKIVRLLDVTMLVEAAAGTGKTTSMVDRLIALLAAGKCDIERLAAVTFTRKAAAELQARFQVELEGSARNASGREATRLRAALEHVERCFIGTIHSLCARLLRERPVEARVDPSFTELDEIADARLREQAWDGFVAELFAEDDPLVDELDDIGLEIADLADAFQKFADYPDVEEWPAPDVPRPDLRPVVAALTEYVGHMRRLLPTLPDDAGKDALIPMYRRIPRMVRVRDMRRHVDVAEVLEQFTTKHVIQKEWPTGKPQALAEQARWEEFIAQHAQPFLAAWRAYRYPTVLRLLQRAREHYDRLREEAGALNFQDLLLRAAALLRDKPEVRRYFRQRFTHVLVDEFQDTDPVQAEVLLLLTAGDPAERDWRKCRPVPGALFVVGDPKQSIYRFRRADIQTYNEVKRIIEQSSGAVVSLTANFRTVAPVVDWVNGTFADTRYFPSVADEFSPQYAALLVGRAKPAGRLSGVFKLPIPADKTNQQTMAEYEAGTLARYIRHALNEGLAENEGDFLVVARQKARLSVYAAALQGLGIPHEVTGGTALNEVRELALLHSCLRAVTEPDDPIALVAVLRSEVFGVSDQALYAFKRAGGRFAYGTVVPDGVPEAEALRDAFERLDRYAQWLAHVPPVAAMERVIADLGLAALAGIAPGGDVQAGSLGKALELLRAAQTELATAGELVDYLGRLVGRKERHDAMSAVAQSRPAVRVMNLHKVKGLEAPVVFLADPSGASEHDVDIHVDRRGRRVVGYLAVFGQSEGWGRPALLAHPTDWETHAQREAVFLRAEENRLLYVAATRAGAQLVVSLRANRPDSNPWQPFAERLADCPVLEDPGPQSAPAVEPAAVTEADVTAAATQIAGRWQIVATPRYALQAAKQAVQAGRVTVGSEHGTEWGAVIHLLLQTLMTNRDAALESLAVAALREQGLDASLAGAAVELVRQVAASDLWRRACRSRRRLVETPFHVVLPAEGDALPTMLRGVVDLAFLEDDGWVIVDYKTDYIEMAAHYAPQVQTYRRVWEELLRQPVKEAGLFFTNAGRFIAV